MNRGNLIKEDEISVLLIGISPPEEGGSQRNVAEIGECGDVTAILTQKGSTCKKAICLPTWNYNAWTRNITFFMLCLLYTFKLLFTFDKKYDAIHTQENLCYLLVPLWSLRYKVVVTVQGLTGFKFYDWKPLWLFFYFGLSFANKIIAVGIADKMILDKEFSHIPNLYVEYIPNGVDTTLYEQKYPRPFYRCMFVGRIHYQKGLDNLLRAFDKLDDKKFELVIVGNNTNFYAKDLMSKHKNSRIKWFGHVGDPKKIADMLAMSYCICLPSRFEGLSLSLCEALASGRPVVTTALPSVTAVVPNDAAVLLKKSDPTLILDALKKIIDNKAMAEKMGERGKIIAQQYDWENIRTITQYEYWRMFN